MSASEKPEFILIWKIKHMHRFYSTQLSEIHSPLFEVDILEYSRCQLVIKKYDKPQKITCRIIRHCVSGFSAGVSVDYQYELTTSDGAISKTSDMLNGTLFNASYSPEYELMKMVDENMPDDVCLRCRLIIHSISVPMNLSPCSIAGWEVETDIVTVHYTFPISLQFPGTDMWTSIKKVTVENIPINIIFQYTNDNCNIEIFSNIEGSTCHDVFCRIELYDQSSIQVAKTHYQFRFGSRINSENSPLCLRNQYLKSADSFSAKKINLKVIFKYKYHSSISEMIIHSNDDSTTLKLAASTQPVVECLPCLQMHLRNMLNENTFADIKLRAGGETFLAHKCLLSTRSPVFQVMFDQDMLESKTNIIDIPDVEAETMKYFLEYLYTGVVKDIDDEMALNLLIVADKYEVASLIEKCSRFLKSVLKLDNVLNTLLAADMVNQRQLKVFTIEYIVRKSSEVLSLPNWSQWVKTNSLLASEVLLKLSNKFESSSKNNMV